jgi:hypothetical protein
VSVVSAAVTWDVHVVPGRGLRAFVPNIIGPRRILNDVIAAHQLTESFPRLRGEVILSYLSDDPVSLVAPGMTGTDVASIRPRILSIVVPMPLSELFEESSFIDFGRVLPTPPTTEPQRRVSYGSTALRRSGIPQSSYLPRLHLGPT